MGNPFAIPQSKPFEKAPAGIHVAIAIRIVDVGTRQTEWKGQKKEQHQIMVTWELPNARMTEGETAGKPFIVSKFYTLSMYDNSRLRKDIDAWRGVKLTDKQADEFNITKLLKVPCMLQIIHETAKDGKEYANINAIMGLPAGTTVPPMTNDSYYLSLSAEYFDPAVFAKLGDKMRERIMETPEWKELGDAARAAAAAAPKTGSASADPNPDDDIPF